MIDPICPLFRDTMRVFIVDSLAALTAITVIVSRPISSTMLSTSQDPVPRATPLPLRSLDYVTSEMPTLLLAVRARRRPESVVSIDGARLGLVIAGLTLL